MEKTIFTKEEIDRIRPLTRDGEIRCLSIDVHGMPAGKAVRFVRNVITLNTYRNDYEGKDFVLAVIHGFNHGTAIKDTLQTRKLTHRPIRVKPAGNNPGMTYLEIS